MSTLSSLKAGPSLELSLIIGRPLSRKVPSAWSRLSYHFALKHPLDNCRVEPNAAFLEQFCTTCCTANLQTLRSSFKAYALVRIGTEGPYPFVHFFARISLSCRLILRQQIQCVKLWSCSWEWSLLGSCAMCKLFVVRSLYQRSPANEYTVALWCNPRLLFWTQAQGWRSSARQFFTIDDVSKEYLSEIQTYMLEVQMCAIVHVIKGEKTGSMRSTTLTYF